MDLGPPLSFSFYVALSSYFLSQVFHGNTGVGKPVLVLQFIQHRFVENYGANLMQSKLTYSQQQIQEIVTDKGFSSRAAFVQQEQHITTSQQGMCTQVVTRSSTVGACSAISAAKEAPPSRTSASSSARCTDARLCSKSPPVPLPPRSRSAYTD